MTRFSVLIDACVLVPIALADTLLRLGEADLYRPLWSRRILDEMVSALAPFGLEVQHPDVFLLNQLDLAPSEVMHALARQAAAARRPTSTVDSSLTRLARCGVPQFAEAAARQTWRIGE